MLNVMAVYYMNTIKPIFKGHSNERMPFDEKMFAQNVPIYIQIPAMKGHLSCRDAYYGRDRVVTRKFTEFTLVE